MSKTIYRKSPNGFSIRNKLPISHSGSRTSKINFLDKDFKPTTILEERVYVKKRICKKRYMKHFPREIEWLKRLKDFDRVPNLIDHDHNSMIMSYVGERAKKSNLPEDWKDQVEYICTELDKYECNHNDIKFGEILVFDGKIHLVDFQYATSTHKEFIKLIGKKLRWIPNRDVLWVKCSIIEEYG